MRAPALLCAALTLGLSCAVLATAARGDDANAKRDFSTIGPASSAPIPSLAQKLAQLQTSGHGSAASSGVGLASWSLPAAKPTPLVTAVPLSGPELAAALARQRAKLESAARRPAVAPSSTRPRVGGKGKDVEFHTSVPPAPGSTEADALRLRSKLDRLAASPRGAANLASVHTRPATSKPRSTKTEGPAASLTDAQRAKLERARAGAQPPTPDSGPDERK